MHFGIALKHNDKKRHLHTVGISLVFETEPLNRFINFILIYALIYALL